MTTAPPAFVITAGSATQVASPALSNQAFTKQWTIAADADKQISAIEALALDLPGQVFITYATPATTTTATGVLGTVTVFGATAALVDSVSVASTRAMRGAKLSVRSSSNSTKPTGTALADSAVAVANNPEFVLTEVVLLRKTALKKVVMNGWADVVILDDVLFTKKKTDYAFSSRRALLAQDASPVFTSSEVERSVSNGTAQVRTNWTILMPAVTAAEAVSLGVQIYGPGHSYVERIDSDLLPEGSIGTVRASNGEVEVTTGSTSLQDLTIKPKTGSSSPNSANTTVAVKLAPSVAVTSIIKIASNGSIINVPTSDLNKTFPDDAVTVFLNGTGNVFVLANSSSMYAASIAFHVAGSGSLQAEVGEMLAVAGVSVVLDYGVSITSYTSSTGVAVQTDRSCIWSANSYSISYPSEAARAGTKITRCALSSVPKKVGGTKTTAVSSGSGSSGSTLAPISNKPSSSAAQLTTIALLTLAMAAVSSGLVNA